MDRAAGGVALQRLEVERLGDDTLGREGRVPVQQESVARVIAALHRRHAVKVSRNDQIGLAVAVEVSRQR